MPDVAWTLTLGLSPPDQGLLASLIAPHDGIDITEGLSPDELWVAITTCFSVYSTARKAQGELRAVIGRLLLVVEKHPEMYQARGFRTYDDFLTEWVPQNLGLPRSECYRMRRLVRLWPKLTPGDFSAIGDGKLQDLSKFTSGEDPKSDYWLEAARTSTRDELRDKIVQAGECSVDDLSPAIIALPGTVEHKKAFLAFVNNPKVQATVGTSHWFSIVIAAFAESGSSWGV